MRVCGRTHVLTGVYTLCSKIITRLNITGVEDVVKGPKGHLGTPKIVLAFGLDHSGLYGLQSAEAQLQEMVEVRLARAHSVFALSPVLRVCVCLQVPVPTPKPKPTIKPAKNATSTAANATTPTNGTNTTDGSASPSASTTPVESLDSTPTPTPSVADTTATNDTEVSNV